jgi:hypothetical protein
MPPTRFWATSREQTIVQLGSFGTTDGSEPTVTAALTLARLLYLAV